MAFGITRQQLTNWKAAVARGEIAYLTHYWLDPRFPTMRSVTKVGSADLLKLTNWCIEHGLNPKYIHKRADFPHFDLFGPKQKEILQLTNQMDQLTKFS